MNRGVVYGLAAYILWGFFPLYWKQLHAVSSGEVVAHRIVWSLGFLALLHIVNRKWVWLVTAVRSPRVAGIFLCSSFLLGINWGLYIWAVQANRIVDASLGYFITPLINILANHKIHNLFIFKGLQKLRKSTCPPLCKSLINNELQRSNSLFLALLTIFQMGWRAIFRIC